MPLPKMSEFQIRRLSQAKSYKYFKLMIQDIIDKRCTFCPLDKKINIPLQERGGWVILENAFPDKKKTSNHFLILPRKHVISPIEMSQKDWANSGLLIAWAIKEFNIPGGGLLTRFGDPFLNAGTQEHLHINLIQPNGKVEYRPPLCKNPEELNEGLRRMKIYTKLYGGMAPENLTPEETSLVNGRI